MFGQMPSQRFKFEGIRGIVFDIMVAANVSKLEQEAMEKAKTTKGKQEGKHSWATARQAELDERMAKYKKESAEKNKRKAER